MGSWDWEIGRAGGASELEEREGVVVVVAVGDEDDGGGGGEGKADWWVEDAAAEEPATDGVMEDGEASGQMSGIFLMLSWISLAMSWTSPSSSCEGVRGRFRMIENR